MEKAKKKWKNENLTADSVYSPSRSGFELVTKDLGLETVFCPMLRTPFKLYALPLKFNIRTPLYCINFGCWFDFLLFLEGEGLFANSPHKIFLNTAHVTFAAHVTFCLFFLLFLLILCASYINLTMSVDLQTNLFNPIAKGMETHFVKESHLFLFLNCQEGLPYHRTSKNQKQD